MDPHDTRALADADLDRRFGGVARIYGAQAYARLRAAHVVVVGLGGVGSWAAEALARSAVGHLTLIDLDHIAESNTNRQVHALGDSFGKAKVLAMAERLVAINPALRVDPIEEFVTPENAATLVPVCDAVLDCIDQVSAKAALIAACRARRIAVLTSGAGGGRIDPTRVRCDDLARALGDPLLAKVRYRLRRQFAFAREKQSAGGAVRVPKFGVTAVYSDEPVRGTHQGGTPLACAGYGSVVTVTASLGLALAACGLRKLTSAASSGGEAGPA
jgi:tRNA A37 threonylcarbamoyladenosine dehydratase